MRGIAACWVMLGHFHEPRIGTGQIERILGHRPIAVDLFFILSGFVLAMNYGHEPGVSLPAYCRFIERRAARLMPLNVLATIICFGLTRSGIDFYAADPAIATGPALVANLFMVQAWDSGASLNAPAWSLSTEWASNLLFPAFASLGLRRRRSTVTFVTVLAIAGVTVSRLLCTNDLHGVFPDWSMLPGGDHTGWRTLPRAGTGHVRAINCVATRQACRPAHPLNG